MLKELNNVFIIIESLRNIGVKDMNKNKIEKLICKISEQYKLSIIDATAVAEKIINDCSPILIENVWEWAEDRPFTDIYIGKYCLSMILKIWNSEDFLRALEVMQELLEGNIKKAELKIWEMRR